MVAGGGAPNANGAPPAGAELIEPKTLFVLSVDPPKLKAFVASVAFAPMPPNDVFAVLLLLPPNGDGLAGADPNACTGAALNENADFGSAATGACPPNEGVDLSPKLKPDEKLPLPKAGGAVVGAFVGLNTNGEGLFDGVPNAGVFCVLGVL